MSRLTLYGKITVFKSLAIAKIAYLTMMTPIFKMIINIFQKMQKRFLWGNSNPIIKQYFM